MQRLVKKQISCIVAMVMVLLLAMSVIVPDKTYAATSLTVVRLHTLLKSIRFSRVIYRERF